MEEILKKHIIGAKRISRLQKSASILAMSLAMSSFPFSSEAQIAPETDVECEIVNEEAICEGDLSEGVVANFAGPSFNTLTIQNLSLIHI